MVRISVLQIGLWSSFTLLRITNDLTSPFMLVQGYHSQCESAPIDYNWGDKGPFGLNDSFSVRWTGVFAMTVRVW